MMKRISKNLYNPLTAKQKENIYLILVIIGSFLIVTGSFYFIFKSNRRDPYIIRPMYFSGSCPDGIYMISPVSIDYNNSMVYLPNCSCDPGQLKGSWSFIPGVLNDTATEQFTIVRVRDNIIIEVIR